MYLPTEKEFPTKRNKKHRSKNRLTDTHSPLHWIERHIYFSPVDIATRRWNQSNANERMSEEVNLFPKTCIETTKKFSWEFQIEHNCIRMFDASHSFIETDENKTKKKKRFFFSSEILNNNINETKKLGKRVHPTKWPLKWHEALKSMQ